MCARRCRWRKASRSRSRIEKYRREVRTWRLSTVNWLRVETRGIFAQPTEILNKFAAGRYPDPMAVAQNLKRAECQAHARVDRP